MAYQFADGFDNYGNNYTMTAGYPWSTITGSTAPTVTTADYRFSPPGSLPGGCVSIAVNNSLIQNLSATEGTIILGFGFKTAGLPVSYPTDICRILDTGSNQVSLGLTANGALQFYRGAVTGTAIGAASPNGAIAANTWYGIALQVMVAGGTSGSVVLYLNGSATPTINSTGLNTSATGNAYGTQVGIGSSVSVSQGAQKYDDFYCFDGSGGSLNALLGGDARVLTKMPASAGTYTNWTPNGLGSNFQNAAVQPPSTSDYNANNTSTTKDS